MTKPVNASEVLLLQAVPISAANWRVRFNTLRRDWTHGRPKGNDLDLIRMTFLALNIARLEAAAVPGAFAELGVWRGNSAKVIHRLAPGRRFYLFDTFAGFKQEDAERDPARDSATHFRDTTLETVKAFLDDSQNLTFCPGWFPETAAAVPQQEVFAFVHLDCDLYRPMKSALEFFYPRMSPGGMIAIHDYGSGRWPGVAQAVDEFLSDKPEGLVCVPDTSGTAALIRAKWDTDSHPAPQSTRDAEGAVQR